jgi:uncharacterized protein YoxC
MIEEKHQIISNYAIEKNQTTEEVMEQEATIHSLQKEIKSLNHKLASQSVVHLALNKKHHSLHITSQQTLDSAEKRFYTLDGRFQQLSEEYEKLKEEKQQLLETYNETFKQNEELFNELSQIQEHYSELQSSFHELSLRNSQNESTIANLTSNSSFGHYDGNGGMGIGGGGMEDSTRVMIQIKENEFQSKIAFLQRRLDEQEMFFKEEKIKFEELLMLEKEQQHLLSAKLSGFQKELNDKKRLLTELEQQQRINRHYQPVGSHPTRLHHNESSNYQWNGNDNNLVFSQHHHRYGQKGERNEKVNEREDESEEEEASDDEEEAEEEEVTVSDEGISFLLQRDGTLSPLQHQQHQQHQPHSDNRHQLPLLLSFLSSLSQAFHHLLETALKKHDNDDDDEEGEEVVFFPIQKDSQVSQFISYFQEKMLSSLSSFSSSSLSSKPLLGESDHNLMISLLQSVFQEIGNCFLINNNQLFLILQETFEKQSEKGK